MIYSTRDNGRIKRIREYSEQVCANKWFRWNEPILKRTQTTENDWRIENLNRRITSKE